MFHRSKLDNGLNVVTDYLPEARGASVHWALRAGARYEAVPGAAHYLEHILAHSLRDDGQETSKWLDDVANDSNFATGPGKISGYADILPELVPEVIQSFGDLVSRPRWNNEIWE